MSRATGAGGAKGDSYSYDPHSDYPFASNSINLSPDDTDAFLDVYIRDTQSSVTSLESRATPGYRAREGRLCVPRWFRPTRA